MAIKITIPGADFSGLGNPKVESYAAGFPAANLSALYLFEDGAVGSPVTMVQDVSGNGRNAPMVLNSTAVKTATGVGNVADSSGAPNRGFSIRTPIAVSPRFTVFGVVQDLSNTDGAGGVFFNDWLGSGNTQTPSNPNITESNNWGTAQRTSSAMGALLINHETNQSSAAARANVGCYNNTGEVTGQPWVSGQGVRPTRNAAVGTRNNWIAWALAFDRDVGVRWRCLSLTAELLDVADATAWVNGQVALAGTHLFGIGGFGSSAIKGQMGICGVYDGVAKTDAEMDVVLNAAKARMALRGITAL